MLLSPSVGGAWCRVMDEVLLPKVVWIHQGDEGTIRILGRFREDQMAGKCPEPGATDTGCPPHEAFLWEGGR